MKLCRYDDDRLGLVQGDEVLDVTGALEVIPAQRWPIAPGDPLILSLDLSLRVNGELRQNSNTRRLVYNVERLIERATSFYTLYPGDLIFTGAPKG